MSDPDDDKLTMFSDAIKTNHRRITKLLLQLDIPIEVAAPEYVASPETIAALLDARTLLYLLPMPALHREALSTAILDFLGGLVHAGLAVDDPGEQGWLMENAILTMLRVHEEITIACRLITGRVSDEELETGQS